MQRQCKTSKLITQRLFVSYNSVRAKRNNKYSLYQAATQDCFLYPDLTAIEIQDVFSCARATLDNASALQNQTWKRRIKLCCVYKKKQSNFSHLKFSNRIIVSREILIVEYS